MDGQKHPAQEPIYDVLGIGFGPANLAISVALAEANGRRGGTGSALMECCFLEAQDEFRWHPGMMITGSRMQISFLKDLATFRNPSSPYTFLHYLHAHGRLASFVNRSTFTPTRREFADYLAWVSHQVLHAPARPTGIHVHYAQRVTSVEPVRSANGDVDHLLVRSTSRYDGSTAERRCRNLVVSTGGLAQIPAPFAHSHPHPRMIHTSEYLHRIDGVLADLQAQHRTRSAAHIVSRFGTLRASSDLDSDTSGASSPLPITPESERSGTSPVLRIGVVGGGQSAAETVLETYARLNRLGIEAEIELVIRKGHLRPSDDSPFANEVFDPQSTQFFYGLGERDEMAGKNAREVVLDESKSTNYGVVNPETLKSLYETIYSQKVEDQARSTSPNQIKDAKIIIHRHTVIKDLDCTLTATLDNLLTGSSIRKAYDVLILGTGYTRQSWKTILFGSQTGLAEIFTKKSRSSSGARSTSSIEDSLVSDSSDDDVISENVPHYTVARNYRLMLPTKLEDPKTGQEVCFRPTIWLQGCNEATHGISDSLLSVLAVRSGEVADGIESEGWFGK